MKHLLSRWRKLLLWVFIPLLISLACVTLTADTPADSQTNDMTFGTGAFTLLDVEAGLANLPSYKATLIINFDGSRGGQSSQWSKTYVMLTTREPHARQLTIEKTGDLSDLDAVIWVEVGEAAYEKRGENTCIATLIEEGNSLSDRLEPASFLNGVIGAEEAGNETVNDVAADHYTFDESAFGQSDIAQSTGEMWVAAEGGYIVKYVLTTKGDADYFGEGIEGTLTWDYELTDVNQPVTFALPDDCPAGRVDAPLLPDATNILNVPSLLTYDTASTLADAAAFYQEQIPALGWTLLDEPTITETSAMMGFTQADQILTVIITADGTGTKVQIVLDKAQK